MAKVPILIEISVKYQEMIDGFAQAQREIGIMVTAGGANNASFVIQTALFRFHKALKDAKITQSHLLQWQEGYRVERSSPRKRTNVTVEAEAIALIPEIAKMMLEIAPTLTHVYHGETPNNKMVIFFAISYIAPPAQQG